MTDPIGQRIRGYQLLLLLGSGSSARVYLGKQRRHSSYAAIKLLSVDNIPERLEGYTMRHSCSLASIIRIFCACRPVASMRGNPCVSLPGPNGARSGIFSPGGSLSRMLSNISDRLHLLWRTCTRSTLYIEISNPTIFWLDNITSCCSTILNGRSIIAAAAAPSGRLSMPRRNKSADIPALPVTSMHWGLWCTSGFQAKHQQGTASFPPFQRNDHCFPIRLMRSCG